jgi:hypothetical protein
MMVAVIILVKVKIMKKTDVLLNVLVIMQAAYTVTLQIINVL